MATQLTSNVALLMGSSSSTGTSGSVGKVVDQRQEVAAVAIDSQVREQEVTQEDIERAVSQLEAYIQNARRDMDFSVDDTTGRYVVRVIDSESKELIRQIPSEEMLAISRHIAESLDIDEPKGFLIELKA